MSTPPHLTLISEVLPVQRRDFTLTDPTLLNPNNANPLYDGEWLELDSSYKLVRGGAGEGANPAWQLFAERGRYDTQAISKAPILFIGGYEAETSIVNLTGLSVGSPLSVNDVTVDATTKRGLALTGVTSGEHLIVGYVTRVLTSTVRFWKVEPQWKHHA